MKLNFCSLKSYARDAMKKWQNLLTIGFGYGREFKVNVTGIGIKLAV